MAKEITVNTCSDCGASVLAGAEGFNNHILVCEKHHLDDSELDGLGIDPAKCKHRNPGKFLSYYNVIAKYPRETKVRHNEKDSTDSQYVSSEYVHHASGIIRIDYKALDRNITDHTIRPIMQCSFRILSSIRFNEMEDSPHSWNVLIDDVAYTGTLEEILKEIEKRSRVVGSKEEARQAVAHVLTMSNVPSQSVYPCVGLFVNEKKEAVFASKKEDVLPVLDSQKTFARIFNRKQETLARLKATVDFAERRRNVFRASVDFIAAMPEVNRLPALMARGYGIIAPLAYELKDSVLGIFPYMYLYGPRNSAKTHIAKYAVSRVYGELEGLNSESVQSSFRLGQEFAGTKFPRLIDEAQDIFADNQAIFKSAATGLLATKRGNKDKTMDSYPAFCTFMLTSNVEPISAEEDAQGGVIDRVIVVPCNYGDDFDNKRYKRAADVMQEDSFLIGDHVIEYLMNIIGDRDRGMKWIEDEIIDRADEVMILYPKLQQRRAYSLAEVLLGIDMYLDMLEKLGVRTGEFYDDRKKMHLEVLEVIQAKASVDEKAFMRSLIEWVRANATATNAHSIGVYDMGSDRYLITSNTLKFYSKATNSKVVVKSMDHLAQEFRKLGANSKSRSYNVDGFSFFGIEVNATMLEKQLNETEQEDADAKIGDFGATAERQQTL